MKTKTVWWDAQWDTRRKLARMKILSKLNILVHKKWLFNLNQIGRCKNKSSWWQQNEKVRHPNVPISLFDYSLSLPKSISALQTRSPFSTASLPPHARLSSKIIGDKTKQSTIRIHIGTRNLDRGCVWLLVFQVHVHSWEWTINEQQEMEKQFVCRCRRRRLRCPR